MTRSAAICSVVSFFVVSAISPAAGHAAEKPNIVYLLVDNSGWGDISVQGSTVQTPRIDEWDA